MKKKRKNNKQAVILIHGIGEQRPMDTLRGFVKAVWETDKAIHHPHAGLGIFSKPDEISESFELRRLTTTKNKKNVRTDFYEYYWAHLMEGNEISHVVLWLRRILFRMPWNLPKPLIGIWFFIVFAIAGAGYYIYQQALGKGAITSGGEILLSMLLLLVLLPIFKWVIEHIVGDAARYLDSSPKNIKSREEIRAKGVEILKKMHDCGKYDRIIMVGHSLGTVIAYDILTHAWPQYNQDIPKDATLAALDEMEKNLESGNLDTTTYRKAQHEVYKELLENGGNWLVSDLVTLGSQLTYADLLLAADEEDLRLKQVQRELPTSPPQLDKGAVSYVFNGKRNLHYAAVFAATRWSNVYFPPRIAIIGDIISGPLQPSFGFGIKDIKTKTSIVLGLASHTRYWTPEKGTEDAAHIKALRDAVNLLDE